MNGAGLGIDSPGAVFSYHRAVAPMLWVMMGLIIVEGLVVHLLVALWSAPAALVLSIISFALIVWFIRFVLSLRRYPVRMSAEGLIWPIGYLRCVAVPWDQIDGLREDWTLADLKAAGLFNAALIAHPNIVVALDPPARAGRRRIRFLAHRLDDPATFVAVFCRGQSSIGLARDLRHHEGITLEPRAPLARAAEQL